MREFVPCNGRGLLLGVRLSHCCLQCFQLTSACHELHDVFFAIPVAERMRLVEQLRLKKRIPESAVRTLAWNVWCQQSGSRENARDEPFLIFGGLNHTYYFAFMLSR